LLAYLGPIAHNLTVNEGRFSPDSRFLVLSSSVAKQIRWWEIGAPGMPMHQLEVQHPIRELRLNAVGLAEDAKEAVKQQIEIGVLLVMTMNVSQWITVSSLSAITYINIPRQLPCSQDWLRTPRTPNWQKQPDAETRQDYLPHTGNPSEGH
jgi:hypothetical protein